jgi:hypothetical protein
MIRALPLALLLTQTLLVVPALAGSKKAAKTSPKKTDDAKPPEPKPEPKPLEGSAKIIGFGPARQITVNNDSDADWTDCELRLPTNKRYMLKFLKARDHESVVLPKFNQDGVEYDKPLDQITVKCEQGTGTFSM